VKRELLPILSIIDAVSVCPNAKGAIAAAVANAMEDFMMLRKAVYEKTRMNKSRSYHYIIYQESTE